MVGNSTAKRPRGRPRGFAPEEALDRAVEMFWVHGYDGVDVDRIARAVGVTKPALYREFGDKPSLLLRAVRRYAETFGSTVARTFDQETDIRKAVANFCEQSVMMATSEGGRTGCLMASSVLGESQRVADIRALFMEGMAAGADLLTRRFDKEMKAGRLAPTVSARVRGLLLTDLMQGTLLRARAGVSRGRLLDDVRSYLPLILS